ncbi:hypothetical protein, partial [Bifidobacterium longum]|uniref:hypothetical protein n=1 Tax=Bifidobacterium longum TaxID=216816 RepID=UPI001EDB2E8A
SLRTGFSGGLPYKEVIGPLYVYGALPIEFTPGLSINPLKPSDPHTAIKKEVMEIYPFNEKAAGRSFFAVTIKEN